jgi:hypothetical protein
VGFFEHSVAYLVFIMEFLDILHIYEVMDKWHLVVHKMKA